MSRKRTPDQESTETHTPAETTTAVAEPPAAEAKPEGQSFAERVGQRQRIVTDDPYAIATDAIADVRLFESKRDRQMAIQFGKGRPESKPSQAVIGMLKEAGYRWNLADRIWAHPVRPDSAKSARVEAEGLFQVIRQIIRHEKGIEPAPELPS
jgi:hypothetical protein